MPRPSRGGPEYRPGPPPDEPRWVPILTFVLSLLAFAIVGAFVYLVLETFAWALTPEPPAHVPPGFWGDTNR